MDRTAATLRAAITLKVAISYATRSDGCWHHRGEPRRSDGFCENRRTPTIGFAPVLPTDGWLALAFFEPDKGRCSSVINSMTPLRPGQEALLANHLSGISNVHRTPSGAKT